MEWFLRAYRFLLLAFAFLFGLAASFVIGGGVTECLGMPEQPDYRNVLDKVTQDMDIHQLKHLLNEHFYCSTEMNLVNADFPNLIWVAPGQDVRASKYCLIAKSYGDSWSHEYIFYFGVDGKLLGIAACFPRRIPNPSSLPERWKWEPRFVLPHVQSTTTKNQATATIGSKDTTCTRNR